MSAARLEMVQLAIADKLSELPDLYVFPYPKQLNLEDPAEGCLFLDSVDQGEASGGRLQPTQWRLQILLDSDVSGEASATQRRLFVLMADNEPAGIMQKLRDADLPGGARCIELEVSYWFGEQETTPRGTLLEGIILATI